MDDNKLIIRYAKEKDINEIYNIGVSYKDFRVSKKTVFYGKEEIRQWIKDKKNNIFIVGIINSKITGFAYCKIISKYWAMLDNFFILPEFRKEGFGSKLENFLEKELKKRKNVYLMALVKPEKNSTRKFLKKYGFKERDKYIWIDKFLKK